MVGPESVLSDFAKCIIVKFDNFDEIPVAFEISMMKFWLGKVISNKINSQPLFTAYV